MQDTDYLTYLFCQEKYYRAGSKVVKDLSGSSVDPYCSLLTCAPHGSNICVELHV